MFHQKPIQENEKEKKLKIKHVQEQVVNNLWIIRVPIEDKQDNEMEYTF